MRDLSARPAGERVAALVMAREPVPGRCKTRLQPLLGPYGCARLQTALLRHAAAWAATVAPGAAYLAIDPPGAAPGVDGVRVFAQEGEDFGARLANAAAHVFAEHEGPLLLVGTDLPVLGAAHATEALAALARGADVVLGPAADGGYWLIGLRARADAAFALPVHEWGGPGVLELSVAAAADAGLAVSVLGSEEHDLDVPADAAHALADPRTPAVIRAALGRPGPLVSVCVPTLREAGQIGALLDHLAALDGCWEVIVADGGSGDATVAIARAHPRADHVLEHRGGRAAQLNAAAAVARGELVLFLHADSRLPPAAYAALSAAHADPGLVGGNFALRFDGGDRFSALLGLCYAAQRRRGFYYGDSSVWVRRSVLEALCGHRELAIMDDYDFVRRLEAHGRTAALPGPAVTSARRWQAMGIARTLLSWWLIRWLYVAGVSPRVLRHLYRVVR